MAVKALASGAFAKGLQPKKREERAMSDELPNRSELHHEIKQTSPDSPMWECTISGTVTLPSAGSSAWRSFFNIAAERIKALKQ